jgi:hypothetical protein
MENRIRKYSGTANILSQLGPTETTKDPAYYSDTALFPPSLVTSYTLRISLPKDF